ncbi:MAG TPA: hypothetical protein DD490_23010 [Acidobacteria bacterium]|nr:hypothetical protein [Acidobacteriota bacterium]
MIEVIVVGEGQTEEIFVRDVLAPVLAGGDIFLEPRLIRTSSSSRGGGLSRDRVVRYLRNTLRERGDTYVTTLFDLYGLAAGFPGVAESAGTRDPIARARSVEESLREVVTQEAGCRQDRFVPYIQPHEFESLLFSDIGRLVEVRPEWMGSLDALRAARQAAMSPEHVNDGAQTHPSARLKVLKPTYVKTLHGPAAAQRIGLDRICAECRHFAAWVNQLESLPPLR